MPKFKKQLHCEEKKAVNEHSRHELTQVHQGKNITGHPGNPTGARGGGLGQVWLMRGNVDPSALQWHQINHCQWVETRSTKGEQLTSENLGVGESRGGEAPVHTAKDCSQWGGKGAGKRGRPSTRRITKLMRDWGRSDPLGIRVRGTWKTSCCKATGSQS